MKPWKRLSGEEVVEDKAIKNRLNKLLTKRLRQSLGQEVGIGDFWR